MKKRIALATGIAAVAVVTGTLAVTSSTAEPTAAEPTASASPAPRTATPTPAAVKVKMFSAGTVAKAQECMTAIGNANSVLAAHAISHSEYAVIDQICDQADALIDYDGGTAVGPTPANNAQVLIGQEKMQLSLNNLKALTQGGLGTRPRTFEFDKSENDLMAILLNATK